MKSCCLKWNLLCRYTHEAVGHLLAVLWVNVGFYIDAYFPFILDLADGSRALAPAAVHLLPNVKWKGWTTIDHFHTASAYIVFGVCFTPLSMHRLYCWPFSKRLYHLNADCVTIYKHGLNGAQQMNSSIFHRLEMNCNQCILFLKKLNQVSVFLIYLRIGSGLWNTQWNSRSDPIHIVPWMTSMFVCSSRVFFPGRIFRQHGSEWRASLDWHWVVWLFVFNHSCSMVVLENGRP